MSSKHDKGKTIWDVIFSLDSNHFPIQRNYTRHPRGSLNSINSQVTMKVCEKSVNWLKDSIKDINDLYALDYELNYTIRKLADLILYANLCDINESIDPETDYAALREILNALDKILKNTIDKYRISPFCTETGELLFYSAQLAKERIRNGHKKFQFDVNIQNPVFNDFALLQQSIQYLIEHSDYDWKAKAEAFLHSTSTRDYGPADDETIIYLKAQGIKDKKIEEEAQSRWKQYKKEWEEVYFAKSNPYDETKACYDRLRIINWHKLADLRLFEPDLSENYRLHSYHYKLENQHLLSAPVISDYSKVFSLFRTDLDVDPIRDQLLKLLKKYYFSLTGNHWYEYNYTASDLHYLTTMLFSFATSRFQHDIRFDTNNTFLQGTRREIQIDFPSSTTLFTKNISSVTLIALEIHCLYYSRPLGHKKFFEKAKEWLMKQQTSYGYWYDGANTPEYTTVLVLDALRLIDDEAGVSFPLKTKPKYESDKNTVNSKPLLIINAISKELQIGDKRIKFLFKDGKNKTWDFISEMACSGIDNIPIPIHRYKDQYDTLRNMIKKNMKITSKQSSTLLKHFIESNGSSYRITSNVKVAGIGDVFTQSGGGMIENIDPKAMRKRF